MKYGKFAQIVIECFFFSYTDDCFVMLHHFVKKTQKTPRKEIEQAKRNRKDYIERNKGHE